MKKVILVVATALLAVLVVACAAQTTQQPAPTPTPVPEPEPAAEEASDIVDTAVAAGSFETLVAAVQAAGLVETLQGEGPFTVFAPSDEAFAALPDGTVEALLEDIPTLTNILLYHVVPGKVMAADVVDLDSADTAAGIPLPIRVEDGMVYVGDSQVVATDIETSNGVIHVVDSVILPPSDDEAMEDEEAMAEEETMDIVDTAVAAGSFETLVAAVQAAGLVETLQGEGPFTVFAPSDEAFAALPDGTVEALLEDIPTLTNILLYHVVPGKVMAADVVDLDSADTAAGIPLPIRVEDGMVYVGDSQVVATDIETSNGVIHVVDSVILPPSDDEAMEDEEAMAEEETMDIVDTAVAAGSFETLVAAVQAAGLVETLQGEGPFTVFAPSDEAFAALPDGTVEALLEDIPTLTNILLYHVVPGKVMAADVVDLDSADTAAGIPLPIRVEDGMVYVGDSQVVATDIETSNGVIHVVDSVILPPSDDEAMEDEEAMAEEETMDIVDTAVAAGSFETLVAAVQAAGLVETLQGEGPFTVFAPSDEAFAALPDGTVEALLEDIPTLTNILLYHVVPGEFDAASVVNHKGSTLDTAAGLPLPVKVLKKQDNKVTVGGAEVIATDIVTANGIIHVVSSVILPPEDHNN